MNRTKAEKQQQAIKERLENEYPVIFIHYVAAKNGKPVDPEDALNTSRDA